jgi:ribosomal protein S18 acetylase RimI-like enzyme
MPGAAISPRQSPFQELPASRSEDRNGIVMQGVALIGSSTARPEDAIHLVRHRGGALRLRLLPGRLEQLRLLFEGHSFWAHARTRPQLAAMLRGSQAAVSAWQGRRLVGFGRATSDGVFRAVLWDVVVAEPQQGHGLGRRLVAELLSAPAVRRVERVYLMTTNSAGFYRRLGFDTTHRQQLLVWHPTGRP